MLITKLNGDEIAIYNDDVELFGEAAVSRQSDGKEIYFDAKYYNAIVEGQKKVDEHIVNMNLTPQDGRVLNNKFELCIQDQRDKQDENSFYLNSCENDKREANIINIAGLARRNWQDCGIVFSGYNFLVYYKIWNLAINKFGRDTLFKKEFNKEFDAYIFHASAKEDYYEEFTYFPCKDLSRQPKLLAKEARGEMTKEQIYIYRLERLEPVDLVIYGLAAEAENTLGFDLAKDYIFDRDGFIIHKETKNKLIPDYRRKRLYIREGQ